MFYISKEGTSTYLGECNVAQIRKVKIHEKPSDRQYEINVFIHRNNSDHLEELTIEFLKDKEESNIFIKWLSNSILEDKCVLSYEDFKLDH